MRLFSVHHLLQDACNASLQNIEIPKSSISKGGGAWPELGRLFGLFECACFIIVRPFRLAFERGMIIQAFVPQWGSAAGGPCGQMWYPGEKWTDYTRL